MYGFIEPESPESAFSSPCSIHFTLNKPPPRGDRGAASSPRFMTSHTNPVEMKAHLSYSLSGHREIASHCLQGGRITPTTRKMRRAHCCHLTVMLTPALPTQTLPDCPTHHTAWHYVSEQRKAPYRNL